MSEPAAIPQEVAAVFDAIDPPRRAALIRLRALVLEAAADAAVQISETLKWGEPAYLPAKPRVGTTVRLNALKGSADGYALFLNCKTTLLEQYRHLYPEAFGYDGQRGVLLTTAREPDAAALKHCITLALTYHRR